MSEVSTPWLRLNDARLRLDGALFFRGIDWAVCEGERWAVVGPNGAGKTVLAELATGRRAAAGGECWLDPAIAADVAWVSFEAQRELCENDTRHDISEYLANAVDAGTTVRELLGGVRTGDAARVCSELGIESLLARGVRFLSSGETRRVLLARILVHRPALAILDDPLEGVDANARARIAPFLERLLASSTRVLLLARNEARLPAGISHVLRLDSGRVTRRGPRTTMHPPPANQADHRTTLPPPPAGTHPMPWGRGPLLQLDKVSARYGEQLVLDAVDLRLEPGEHLCLAGPNGCGKSTLLALVCGDNPRAYGQRVRVCGRLRGDGESIAELRRRFGLVSNALHLGYPARTRVADVVASGLFDTLGLYEACSPDEAHRVEAWLAALGLETKGGARFDALSFGVQRLVLIARAMIKCPPLLILDEPCSGLDAHNRARVLELVDRIAATGSTQVLWVSHEHDEMPHCVTRRLEFRRDPERSTYTLVEAARSARTEGPK